MKHALNLLRRWFFTGLLIWAPFIGTIFLFFWVFGLLDNWAQKYAIKWIGHQVPGLGLALLLLSTILVGALVSNFVGKRLHTIVESLISRIPAFNVVYRFFKDFANTFLGKERGAFREVVAVRFPTPQTWAVGFITGPVPPALAAVDHEEKVLVFIMQAFSPATGFLIALPRSDTIKLDMPVDEAIKMILTGGLVKSAAQTHATPHDPAAPAEPEQLSTMMLSRK
jgi:uncharacterized membrane protein